MNPSSTFADIEIILRLLRNVERRIRSHRLAHELTLGLCIVLIVLIALKTWDLYSPLKMTTVTSAFSACAFIFAAYTAWRVLHKGGLGDAAISVDDKADLYDEMTTACWFINKRLSSDWIDAQIRGAARNAGNIDVRRLYHRRIPHTSYAAAAMFLLFVSLNFVPLSLNHNWLKLQAAPAGVPPQPNELVQNIKEGLEQIAKDLQQSEKTKETAEAMMQKELRKAAEELRKLARQMKQETQDSPESRERMQRSLEQASRNSKPGLEKLAKNLSQASEGLKGNNQQAIQEALEQAANELESLEREMHEPGGGQQQKSVAGGQSPQPSKKKSESETNGTGQDPSGNAPRQGDPATLEVQLEREKLAGMPSGGSVPEDVEEVSKQQLSKLDYRNVKAQLSATPKDLMNQEGIPWEYRSLVKDYFQAIRKQHEHSHRRTVRNFPGPIQTRSRRSLENHCWIRRNH